MCGLFCFIHSIYLFVFLYFASTNVNVENTQMQKSHNSQGIVFVVICCCFLLRHTITEKYGEDNYIRHFYNKTSNHRSLKIITGTLFTFTGLQHPGEPTEGKQFGE